MARPRVYVTRRVDQEALDLLASVADIEVWEEDAAPPREVMLEKAAEVDGIFATGEDAIDEVLLSKGGGRLKVVANMAVGYDNFDVPTATRLGVALANTPGVLTKTTAELGFALILAVARQVVLGDRETRQGKWKYWHPSLYLGQDRLYAMHDRHGQDRPGGGEARPSLRDEGGLPTTAAAAMTWGMNSTIAPAWSRLLARPISSAYPRR